jgi:hypothetical protein
MHPLYRCHMPYLFHYWSLLSGMYTNLLHTPFTSRSSLLVIPPHHPDTLVLMIIHILMIIVSSYRFGYHTSLGCWSMLMLHIIIGLSSHYSYHFLWSPMSVRYSHLTMYMSIMLRALVRSTRFMSRYRLALDCLRLLLSVHYLLYNHTCQ